MEGQEEGWLEVGRLEGLAGRKAARLEGWKAGGLQGWKAGRLEGWKAGGLEGWRAKTCRCFKVGRPNATAVRPSANDLFKLFKCPFFLDRRRTP